MKGKTPLSLLWVRSTRAKVTRWLRGRSWRHVAERQHRVLKCPLQWSMILSRTSQGSLGNFVDLDSNHLQERRLGYLNGNRSAERSSVL